MTEGIQVGGVLVNPTNQAQIRSTISAWFTTASDVGRAFCFINANSIVEANRKRDYMDLLNGNVNNCVDGTSVAIFASLQMGLINPNRIKTPGPDIFNEVTLQFAGIIPQYFVGGSNGELSLLLETLGLSELGTEYCMSAPFTDDIEVLIFEIDRFLDGKPRGIVWLGIGGTKQDCVALKLRDKRDFCFIGVGAAFDFAINKSKRAPKWVNQMGFEWLHRLISEPTRLLRRYTIGNTLFVFLAVRHLTGRMSRTND